MIDAINCNWFTKFFLPLFF